MIPMAIGTVSTVAGAAGRSAAADKAAAAQAEAQARQNQLILQRLAAEEKQQRDLLAKASATQRARMGALGMDGSGGSAEAILAGMSKETADGIAASGQAALLRLQPARAASGANLLDGAAAAKSGLSVFKSFYDAFG
ncbi:hypothetical protein H261_08698 [Paramagnetospirillum caucaseum]|uniref:Uncharacterized protein n=1 Tax=Paramagnetospirillum caucaseum TaxID=1244869 RepID=M3AC65_9PROT|nr:hypothetical protein H261_08698 [Paramagnetospirillum caucaseum]